MRSEKKGAYVRSSTEYVIRKHFFSSNSPVQARTRRKRREAKTETIRNHSAEEARRAHFVTSDIEGSCCSPFPSISPFDLETVWEAQSKPGTPHETPSAPFVNPLAAAGCFP